MYTVEQEVQFLSEMDGMDLWLRQLKLGMPNRRIRTERGYEYIYHGLLRRWETVAHCARAVFSNLPCRSRLVPDKAVVKLTEVNIQAFLFNAFGALDNLAWVWVHESGLMHPTGRELYRREIGFGPNSNFVRNSLSQRFQDELSSYDRWFAHVENFRHALAHRVPLYIPPFAIVEENVAAYRAIDELKQVAIVAQNFVELERLESEQMLLAHFSPVMTHSLFEPAPTVPFHAQIVADVKTLIAITDGLFLEIDSLE